MTTSTDEQSIREVIANYAQGMRTADVTVLKTAFHDLAILCGYLGDELIAAPIVGLYEWVGANPAPDTYEFSILSIETTGRVATAGIRETDDHGTVLDHFHLLHDGTRWSIVSKLWDAEPNT